ncbi:acylphosphatase [Nocardioides sp. GXQ0305]|uniref:acylphosphatase n=1 Tax=Nocardioides sp. GXQ0305 TaxID=3423912 RepID=UPI003D7ECAF2
MKRVHVEVSGLVQGVFFRDSCRREAQSRQVSGWVRNTRGGTVEAEFEGEDAEVDALVAWCRSGPPHASVQRVDTSDVPTTGSTGFEIR